MDDEEGNWLERTNGWCRAFSFGRLPRFWRRLAIIAFPITVPVWMLWQITVIFIFIGGCAFIAARPLWDQE